MDGLDRAERRKSLTERLGLKGMSCCGATWVLGPSPTAISVRDDDAEEEGPQIDLAPNPTASEPVPPCVGQSPAAGGMNLAAALAAERQLRALLDSENDLSPRSSRPRPDSNDDEGSPSTTSTHDGTAPLRVSLMRLLEEADGYDGEIKKEEDRGGCDQVCCVCMGRKKGAAFIPCGHTFCRVCSREMWLNRGSCPLCNRTILDVLDIY